MVYTTAEEVAAELGGVTINTASTPTKAQVEEWILQSDDEINERTGRVWGVTTVPTSDYEYSDYDGSGRIHFNNKPVLSVEELSYDSEGLGVASTAWSAMTEGRTQSEDFIMYLDEGIAYLHRNVNNISPRVGKRNIRKSYTYGYLTTPRRVKRLSTLLAAKRYILSVANKSGTEEGGSVSVGTISVNDPNNYIFNHLGRVNMEIEQLYNQVVTKLKSYVHDLNIY